MNICSQEAALLTAVVWSIFYVLIVLSQGFAELSGTLLHKLLHALQSFQYSMG